MNSISLKPSTSTSHFIIPKLVHLTYKSKETIPSKWKQTIPQWEKYGWKIMFHSDQDNDTLIQDYPLLESTYNSYKIPIQKVDAIRTCYLHKWGGVYADLDLFPTEDLYHYFEFGELFFMRSPNAKLCLTNMLMASRPSHPFWLEYMEALKNPYMPWFTYFKHFKVMYSTGPLLLHQVAEKTSYPYTLLPLSILPCSICDQSLCSDGPLRMLEGQSWNGIDSYIINFMYCNYKKIIWILILLFVILWIYKKQTKTSLNHI
jgi:mannosyltransferase OCH1-like enzyme